MTYPDNEQDDFGYSEDEIPHLSQVEHEAVQEVIKNSPHTIKAEGQIRNIGKALQEYVDGLLLAVETVEQMKRILDDDAKKS